MGSRAGLVATIINSAEINRRLHHAPFDIGVRLTDATGDHNFAVVVTATATNDDGAAAFTPVLLACPSGMTMASNRIMGIEIPTDSKQVDLWFIIDESASLTDEWTSIAYTITPEDSGADTGTPAATLTAYASDYLVGGNNLNQFIIGAGEIYIGGLPLGFFTKDGVSWTWTINDQFVLVDQLPGELAAISDKIECIVKFTPNQVTLDRLIEYHRLTGTVQAVNDILFKKGTYSGLRLDGIPQQGFIADKPLELVGNSNIYDGNLTRFLFPRAVRTGGTDAALKSGAAVGMPLEYKILQDPIIKRFYRAEIIQSQLA